jgi:hypothetical protein
MTKVPVQTYSLKEIATQICGDDLKDPERWVLRCIYAGKFRAIKVGRSYRMTQEQLNEALAALEIKPTTVTSPTPPSGQTPLSQRRQRPTGLKAVPPAKVQPPPTDFKRVDAQPPEVIAAMPAVTQTQVELLERLRREREVIMSGRTARRTVEALVKRGLAT